jgi:hypothetical protein
MSHPFSPWRSDACSVSIQPFEQLTTLDSIPRGFDVLVASSAFFIRFYFCLFISCFKISISAMARCSGERR